MVMLVAFRLPDVVIVHFFHFLNVFIRILGHEDIVIPTSMYKIKKVIGELKFERYVVCRKCHSIYLFEECIEHTGCHQHSKLSNFRKFPAHPHVSMRSPCGIRLLKSEELSNKKVFLYPYLTYCYLGLEVSLQSLFNKPTFYNDCEHWRLRCTAGNELNDIYDGKIWNSFLSFQDEPFLSEPGNLAFILNFDFFQPYEHL